MLTDGIPRPGSTLDVIDPDQWGVPDDDAGLARAQRRDQRARAREARGLAPAGDDLLATTAGRVLVGIACLLAALTVIGLAALWPVGVLGVRGGAPEGSRGPTLPAQVLATRVTPCPGPAARSCRTIDVRIAEGADAGARATLALGPLDLTPAVNAGESVRVRAGGTGRYTFADADRRGPLLWLAMTLAVLVALVAGRRGLVALAGFAVSLVLVVVFLVPAVMAGSDAVLVSLLSALAIMFVTLLVTHRLGVQTLAAAVGIGVCLLLAAVLGQAIVATAHLDWHTGELAPLGAHGLALQGVVVAGMVIGALGVLIDIAVSQACAVTALRAADRSLGPRALYRRAFATGRDRLLAGIQTLALAYLGAALPLLLVTRDAHAGFGDAVNGQIVAWPAIAALVGAITLTAAVAVTTALAALLVARLPVKALGTGQGH
jgi:uncharacterized membrane protein